MLFHEHYGLLYQKVEDGVASDQERGTLVERIQGGCVIRTLQSVGGQLATDEEWEARMVHMRTQQEVIVSGLKLPRNALRSRGVKFVMDYLDEKSRLKEMDVVLNFARTIQSTETP